jgi:hypothetical protein
VTHGQEKGALCVVISSYRSAKKAFRGITEVISGKSDSNRKACSGNPENEEGCPPDIIVSFITSIAETQRSVIPGSTELAKNHM